MLFVFSQLSLAPYEPFFLTFPNTTEVNGTFALPLALKKSSNFCCFEKQLVFQTFHV